MFPRKLRTVGALGHCTYHSLPHQGREIASRESHCEFRQSYDICSSNRSALQGRRWRALLPKRRWAAKHDTILWYTKDPERYHFDTEGVDRIPYMAPGLVGDEHLPEAVIHRPLRWGGNSKHTLSDPDGIRDLFRKEACRGLVYLQVFSSDRPDVSHVFFVRPA